MAPYVDLRVFLSLLLRELPGLGFELPELIAVWCVGDAARQAGVLDSTIEIYGLMPKVKTARVRIAGNLAAGQVVYFPAEDLAAFILTRSMQPEEQKERLRQHLEDSWRRHPEIFRLCAVHLTGTESACAEAAPAPSVRWRSTRE